MAALGGVLAVMGSRGLVAQDSQFGIRGLGAPGTFASVRAWSTGGAFTAFDGMSSLTDAALSDITRLTAAATSIDDYRRVNDGTNESHVYTRFDRLSQARSYLPAGVDLVAVRGVRVLTPASHVFAWEPLGKLFSWAERAACDAPLLRNLGGFLILVARKSGSP